MTEGGHSVKRDAASKGNKCGVQKYEEPRGCDGDPDEIVFFHTWGTGLRENSICFNHAANLTRLFQGFRDLGDVSWGNIGARARNTECQPGKLLGLVNCTLC